MSIPRYLKFQLILGFFFFTFAMDSASQANAGMLAQSNSSEPLETTLRKPTVKADMLNTKSRGYHPRFSNMANMRTCERVECFEKCLKVSYKNLQGSSAIFSTAFLTCFR